MTKIGALTALSSVQPDDVLPVVDVHDTSMASSGTTKKITLAQVTGIGLSNGSNDTAAIQAQLTAARTAGGGIVRGTPGQSYLLSSPLRIGSGTTLDMTGCTVTLLAGSNCNALQNWAVQANRRILDGVTNSTTTFTSATAAFAVGDAGSAIRIYYQDGTWLDTTISSFTNSTTVVLAAAATVSQSGLFAVIGAGRDSSVRVTGGAWVRQSPNGTDYSSHSLRFRHVDGLEIGPVGGSTASGSGKYMIAVGDCTRFYVHDVSPSSTASDTVHVNGPASAGFIARVTNPSPGDDVVAFTCGDYTAYADVMGNITDITVDGVRAGPPPPAAATPFTVKVLAGVSITSSPYLIDRINVRDVKSWTNNYAVNVCDDTGDVKTTGGTWGRIVLDGIVNANPVSTLPAVNATGCTVTDLEVHAASNVNPANTAALTVQSDAVITRLLTDMDRGKVTLVSGSRVLTWISEAQSAESPFSQPSAAYFDGSAVSASVTSASALNPTAGITVEMWFCPSSSQVAFWTPLAKLGQYWIEGSGAGALTCAFTIVSGGTQYGSGVTAALQAGRLNYIAATYASGAVKIYVNGTLATSASTAATTIDTSTNALLIGNRPGFSRFIQGQMADVRIWNAALSASDVAAHYADPGNLATSTAAVLAARWKCDEGAGTTLGDASGNGNNATLSSASWNAPYTPYLVQPQLSTGASHTVDDVIAALQKIGLVHQ